MDLDYTAIENLTEIFDPVGFRKRNELHNGKGLLAHYTSAENAVKIIKSQALWLRNARCMEDYSEIQHGIGQFLNCLDNTKSGISLKQAINSCSLSETPIVDSIIEEIKSQLVNVYLKTYIACFSKYDELDENNGKLSMWRSFGQDVASVALLFEPPRPASVLPLNIYLIPVKYFNEQNMEDEILRLALDIEKNQKYLMDLDAKHQILVKTIGSYFLQLAVSIKHPGFKEENEWRVVYLPELFRSNYVKRTTEFIKGIPQSVYNLEFKDYPENSIVGMELSSILKRIIVGPTQYYFSIEDSIREELRKAKIDNPNIELSKIPIRR